MTVRKGLLLIFGVVVSLVLAEVAAYGKGGGNNAQGGRACNYDRCVDKCVVRTGVGQFANAKCSQKCAVKKGCT
jgi:hypothetical protein